METFQEEVLKYLFSGGVATFDDLQVTGMATGAQLVVSCKDDQDFMHMGTSDDFNVHPFPRTGNLKDANTGFTYKGTAKNVQKVLAAFANALGKEGGPQAKSGQFNFEEDEDVEEATVMEPVILTADDFAAWPISA